MGYLKTKDKDEALALSRHLFKLVKHTSSPEDITEFFSEVTEDKNGNFFVKINVDEELPIVSIDELDKLIKRVDSKATKKQADDIKKEVKSGRINLGKVIKIDKLEEIEKEKHSILKEK